MSREKLGSLIGAVFGLIYIVANSGSLPAVGAAVVRVLGVVAFLAVLVAVRRPDRGTAPGPRAGGFGRGYRLTVVGEVLAIVVGLVLLNGPLHAPEAGVAWVSVVVGAHFLALAIVWKQALFHWLGAALLLCGGVGLVLAAAGAARSAIDLVAGVLPGAILLGFALAGSTVQSRRTRIR